MTENNTTYKQKIGDSVINAVKVVGACMVFVFLFAVGWVAWGAKKVTAGVEYAAEQGQTWAANKATANASQAGSDIKEAYNLYRQQSADEQNTNSNDNSANKVEDEGYCSESEKLTS